MHAFILHLTRAQARRENALHLAETCGLPGEIWAAVDGSKLSHKDKACYLTEPMFAPSYYAVLNDGEIGCFLSHRQIWAEIVRRGLDYALVMEDDLELDQGLFAQALRLATRHIDRFGYIQLQNRPVNGKSTLIDLEGRAALCLPLVTPVRASAQLISQAAAQSLLDQTEQFDRPVDTFVQSHWHTGLRAAMIYPSGVRTVSDTMGGSTIQTKNRGFGQTLKREVGRYLYRRQLANLSRHSPAPHPEKAQTS